jgi:amino acid adenylation domain-containing protein
MAELRHTESHDPGLDWSGPAPVRAVDGCGDICVHDLVSARARANPVAVALASRDGALTYSQLDDRASQVANRLRSLRVGPDVPVAVCLERSPELAVAALGVLKAGGAYLPLDPSYPDERLAFMVRDSEAPVLITQLSMVSRLAGSPETTVVLDDDTNGLGCEATQAPPTDVQPHHLAYVIYTSGSTGTPKGVMIEHRSLLNLVRWHVHAFEVTESDRASQVASPAFDAAVWELWPYLAAGASVHFADEAARGDVRALRDWLWSAGITIGFLPTPLAEAALELDWSAATPLRVLLTGGDALHRHPPPGLPFVLVNNYGPTEATVLVTSATVPPDGPSTRPPSIGRPIANSRIHIVDSALRPVPPGSPGELLIGGRGVGRGYLNRPELTRERFIPDPFGVEPGARLYRTGDLVRERPDGDLDFLGRIDDQVKIRGHRVEPAEIAVALDRHSSVRSSIVTAREHRPGDNRLVAYVLPKEGIRPEPTELRTHLAVLLPDHMVPSDFVYLKEFPLTSNGKVDRNALPDPEEALVRSSDGGREPSGELELDLAAMVGDLLGVERVGADENFFMLGGHSLLAAQLVARVRGRFGVDLPLISVFEAGTVAGLATAVAQLRLDGAVAPAADGGTLVLAAQTSGSRPVLFFLVTDETGLFPIRYFIRALGLDQPVVGLLPPRRQRRFERDKDVVQLAKEMMPTIRAHQPSGPYFLCGHSLGGLLAYEVAGQLRRRGAEVAWLGMMDTMTPASSRRVVARSRRLQAYVHRFTLRAQEVGLRTALREIRRRQVQHLRAHLELPLAPDEYDVEGATMLTTTYRVAAHDAPLDVFSTDRGMAEAGSPALGWQALHRGPVRCHPVPGDHHTHLREPHIDRVLEILGERLDEIHAATDTVPVESPPLHGEDALACR